MEKRRYIYGFRRLLGALMLLMPSFVTIADTTANLLPAEKDSLHLHLKDVEIVETFSIREVRSAAPAQRLGKAELEALNVKNLSDAVKHFAGVVVKDYGGVGGLKTVSIRSLGAQHTGVSYDGISLSDTQSGQIDISRFSLDNVEALHLANGQSEQIFCTARQMASAHSSTVMASSGSSSPLSFRADSSSTVWGEVRPRAFSSAIRAKTCRGVPSMATCP